MLNGVKDFPEHYIIHISGELDSVMEAGKDDMLKST